MSFEVKPIEIGKTYNLDDINFATASFELTKESKLVIDAFVEFLNDNQTVKVELQGHTDNVGSAASNLTLSENRAKSVYDYIVQNGIPASRLKSKGYGQTRPIADNNTEDGRAKNRRTVFVVTGR
jgi:outer membrane protein OmpA-like peptidoglycan-associated protein